jgi:hypothetical protein
MTIDPTYFLMPVHSVGFCGLGESSIHEADLAYVLRTTQASIAQVFMRVAWHTIFIELRPGLYLGILVLKIGEIGL